MRFWHRMQTRLVAAALAAVGAGLVAASAVTALARLVGPIGALGLCGGLLLGLAALLMLGARLHEPRPPEAVLAELRHPELQYPEPRPAESLGFLVGFMAVRMLLRRLG